MNRALLLIAALAGLGFGADDKVAEGFKQFRSQKNVPTPGRFTFVRVRYNSTGGYGESWYTYQGRDWERWETDYPEADENFLYRLSEQTTLDPNPHAIVRSLTDKDIFNYPFLYFCDVGWMSLTAKEKSNLREYLLRGGFVWVDDFWGTAEWESLEEAMREVLPEYKWRDVPKNHPVFNIVFPMDGVPQVPARVFAVQGYTSEPAWIHKSGGCEEAHCRGYFDDKGRLLLIATHNTDIGDGFEREGEGEWYFKNYSIRSYALGINIVVYAMTN